MAAVVEKQEDETSNERTMLKGYSPHKAGFLFWKTFFFLMTHSQPGLYFLAASNHMELLGQGIS